MDLKNVHSIPIWVNLYGIPLELWNPKGISFIASYIGKPLRVDRVTASRRRISYARVCVEVSGDLDLIEKFTIKTEDGNGTNSLLEIDVEYQWKPPRCATCSTFGHDCHKEALQRPKHVAHNPNPYQTNHRTTTQNCRHQNSTNEGMWQVVQRKNKVNKIVEGTNLNDSPRGSPQQPVNQGDRSLLERQVANNDNNPYLARCDANASEHVVHSIIESPSSYENRTANVSINNSFQGLIPYVYDREAKVPVNDCEVDSPCEGTLEKDDTIENFNVVEDETASASPISARQRKREAKMLFSGSRPKSRHRP